MVSTVLYWTGVPVVLIYNYYVCIIALRYNALDFKCCAVFTLTHHLGTIILCRLQKFIIYIPCIMFFMRLQELPWCSLHFSHSLPLPLPLPLHSFHPHPSTLYTLLPPRLTPSPCSHVWIFVVRLNSKNDDLSTIDTFSTDRVTYSDNIAAGLPYVAAEISISNYPDMFVLGEGVQPAINDDPQFSNGPLREGTYYTAFVRVFSPLLDPSVSSLSRGHNRQLDFSPFPSSSDLTQETGCWQTVHHFLKHCIPASLRN